MDYIEINDQLKNLVSDLVGLGYKKTVIGKILLGTSGYAPILKFLDENNEANLDLNLGIKPLDKVGKTIGYDLRLVYVKQDNTDMINGIEEVNNTFFEELKVGLVNYMNSEACNTRKPYTINRKRKNQFEATLEEFLASEIFTK
jgi:hypothetical protein